MSAIIGIVGPEVIHLLTDAASTAAKSGTLLAVHSKQVIGARNRTVIAGIGTWRPVARFARLADERATNFDEVAAMAPEIWREVYDSLSTEEKTLKVRYMLLYAGWSDANRRLMIGLIENGEHDGDVAGYCGGPSASPQYREFIQSFANRFGQSPELFDARRDGVEFMQVLRHRFPMQYATASHPAVGGFIQHTAITRTRVATRVVHHWPDMIANGRPIDINASDEWPSLYRIRENVLSLADAHFVKTPPGGWCA